MGDSPNAKANLFLPDLSEVKEPTRPNKKPIKENLNINWNRKGNLKRIKIKRRVQTVRELKQLHKECMDNQDSEEPEIDDMLQSKGGTDLRSPEEKLHAARGKLGKLGGLNKMLLAKRRTNPNLSPPVRCERAKTMRISRVLKSKSFAPPS